ncbi:MAG: ATP-binding cassette domain-containing protein [Mucinivorans sp.]
MSNQMILETRNIIKDYSSHRALDNVSIAIERGSIYGLLGPNGAGKTTLIRIINQITAPDSGELLFDGRAMIPSDVSRIGYLPEERGLYKKMKVGEQALYLSRLKGLSRADAYTSLRKWFTRFEIQGWWDKKVEELSKGMAQKVQFIVTVIHNPELLIFDEPFSGFDPINANLLKEEILALRDRGATVIFSTHNMSSVEEICDHITLINKSKNILSGRVDDIRHFHGNNIFEVSYRGEEAALKSALAGRCEILEGSEAQSIYASIKLHVEQDSDVRGVVATINEAVELRSFNEIIPSMNDIFIRAVQGKL